MKRKTTITSLLAFAAFVSGSTLPAEAGPLKDETFMRQAFHADLLEGKQAKSALEHVRASDARTLAHMILKHEPTSERSLRRAANASGLALPNKQAIRTAPPRSAISYLKGNIEQQRAALHLFREEARYGDKPPLRAYAQNHIPLIRDELNTAERGEHHIIGTRPTNAREQKAPLNPLPLLTPRTFDPTNPPEPEG